MKSLCLTGASQYELDTLAGLLHGAGMAPPKGAAHDPGMTMAVWHERVTALAPAGDGPRADLPGRPWVQLAGEIFLANMSSALWGWADTRSMALLDFWLDFDPKLHVILAYTSLEQSLADAIDSGADPATFPDMVQGWERRCRHLLDVYAAHRQHCLLVETHSCFDRGSGLLARCALRWNLPLDTSKDVVRGPGERDALALFLARQWLDAHRPAAALQHALAEASALTGAGADRMPGHALSCAIVGYQTQNARARQLEESAAAHARMLDLVAHERDAVLAARTCAETAWTEEKRALLQRVHASDAQRSASQHAQREAQHAAKEAELEHALVEAQLRRVEEEMRHYFDRYRIAERKWRDFLECRPDFHCCATLEALVDGPGDGVGWHIAGLESAGVYVPEIRVETRFVGAHVAIVLSRTASGMDSFVRWPWSDTLEIGPAPTDHGPGVAMLAACATADWKLLRTLVRVLASAAQHPGRLALPAAFPVDALRAGLARLDDFLAVHQDMLRFDHARLRREQVNDDYEHVWIELDNLSFAGRHWPTWHFRLACANVGPGRFGDHPKLEFPADSGPAALETWFEESVDDVGAKMELRFAVPDAIDLDVWRRLSGHDRAFLAALIGRLPAMLADAAYDGATLQGRPWSDWHMLADSMREIVAQRTLPAWPNDAR